MFTKLWRRLSLSIMASMPMACDISSNTNERKNVQRAQKTQDYTPAPDYFRVKFTCTHGEFIVESRREWAPHGVDRFYELIKSEYYHGTAFFRVVPNFIVQFGIHQDTSINAEWSQKNIPDDPTLEKNLRGTLSFGTPRNTHLVINFNDNSQHLDPTNPVFAKVIEGMSVVDEIYSGYGDLPVFGGNSPSPERMGSEGYGFLKHEYPDLDYIISTEILSEDSSAVN